MSFSSILLLLSFVFVSPRTTSPHVYTTTMLASQLARQHAMWEYNQGRQPKSYLIMIPQLDIYSPSGKLIYHGTEHDISKTPQVLEALPKLPSPAPPPDAQMSLPEILESTPDLAKWKNTILNRHDYVVVSTSVSDSEITKRSPYYPQNHAVDLIASRSRVKIDVVRINIKFD